MSIDYSVLAVISVAALFAGLIDSMVGGGGLIQIPALFTALPKEVPATLFGTNKIASVFGTTNAAWRYSRRVTMPWATENLGASAIFGLERSAATESCFET